MEIKYHFLAGLILSIILFPFFGIKSFIALIFSVLIDIDHPLQYTLKYKKFNILQMLRHFRNCCGKQVLCIFHTIEFIIILGLLSLFSDIFLIMFIAATIHMCMDYLDWFVWASIYSQRMPSIILWPLLYRRSKLYETWVRKLGGKCIVCDFDKSLDIHFVFSNKAKAVLICPNHHFMLHAKQISEEDLFKHGKKL